MWQSSSVNRIGSVITRRISSQKAAKASGSWVAPPGRSHSSIPRFGKMTWAGASDWRNRFAISRAVSRRSSALRPEDLISRLWAWKGRSEYRSGISCQPAKSIRSRHPGATICGVPARPAFSIRSSPEWTTDPARRLPSSGNAKSITQAKPPSRAMLS